LKLVNNIKQYGIIYVIKSLIYRLLRPIYQKREFVVLCIHEHVKKPEQKEVLKMSLEDLEEMYDSDLIEHHQYKSFSNFLKNKCISLIIKEQGELAAWGFIQTEGEYKYGKGKYIIPKGIYILKNLYVKPEYRGKSYGKKINLARVNAVPEGSYPVGFVVSKNRYAIRNLKMFGFEESLSIVQEKWLGRNIKTKIEYFDHKFLTDKIAEGFKTN